MKRAMTKKRNRPEEILAKFRGTDKALPQGKSLQDFAISFGVYLITLHLWRTEYGSADRDAVKRLKELERENGRPKRLVMDQTLDI
jgi:putative transposase